MLAGELRTRPPGISADRGMPVRSRVLSKDEELGKRDDDFRPARSRFSVMSSLLPWHWRRRRLFVALVLVGTIYLFLQYIPSDVSSTNRTLGRSLGLNHYGAPHRFPSASIQSATDDDNDSTTTTTTTTSTTNPNAPPRPKSVEDDEKSNHYFDGPIKFWNLGESLQAILMTMGTRSNNNNVLFAASSLKSFANLMPMACAMAKRERIHVHFALFGRSTLTMDELLEINGVQKDACAVFFHDARPDFAEYSSDERAGIATAGAMMHIQNYMHPQALIIDDRAIENNFFTDAMARKAGDIDRPMIEIPSGQYEDFLWITQLDAASLSNWYKPAIDVVIQAPPKSAGSLIRLLKNLRSADYGAIKVPRLTIELPATTDSFIIDQLAKLEWPPNQGRSQRHADLLTIRHRIPSARISSEQASLRFLESFYPKDPNHHHTLILSPQAELSPLYMQYLWFHILKYQYSAYDSPGSDDVMGLSLDSRASKLDGTEFAIPVAENMTSWRFRQKPGLNPDTPVPYLYQAPSSAATLIFGDKWVTLHSFLANRLASSHLGKASKVPKLVSETEPAWMEYLLELMRARGWSLLHPVSHFVSLHNEMAQLPEEFQRSISDNLPGSDGAPAAPKPSAHLDEEGFLIAEEPPVLKKHVENDVRRNYGPLHEVLPLEGDIPSLSDLPYFSHEGKLLGNLDVYDASRKYKEYFMTTIGGCTSEDLKQFRDPGWLDASDLFCLPGMQTSWTSAGIAGDGEYLGDDAAALAQIIADADAKDMDEAIAQAGPAIDLLSGIPPNATDPNSAAIQDEM